ncbi:MAG: Fe-S protein assembly co-chaperone HscB [Saprospirales bacterium]|nr:Fe-S protein assembly co-chaperone HscB [Saprospirales bacterium]
MDFFQYYDLPLSFLLDEADLKRRYYAHSKRLHPDFYTLESEEKQAEILEQSTYNNQAYKALSNFDARMRYILELKGLMPEEGQSSLPQEFLMEMMDVNEQLMELEFDFDAEAYAHVLRALERLEQELLAEVTPTLEAFDSSPTGNIDLQPVVDYYFKKKYLLRIRENLGKFAGPRG